MFLWQVEIKKISTDVSVIHRTNREFETSIYIPLMDENDVLNFYVADTEDESDNGSYFSKTYKDVCKIISDEYELSDDTAEYEKLIRKFIKISDNMDDFPRLTYEDITEQELFGFDPVSSGTIEDPKGGLWACHGKRKFKFYMQGENSDIDDDVHIEKKLYFYKCDNKDIDRIEFNIVDTSNDDNNVCYVMIDTDKLGEVFTGDNDHCRFEGKFEIIYTYTSVKDYAKVDVFPVIISLQNTHYPSCSILNKSNYVSIDFGTSSSCIAIATSRGIELIALSPTKEGQGESISFNRFENPTNIMIYRWDKIYKEWIERADFLPHFKRGSRAEAGENTNTVMFDSGYNVKELLEEVDKKVLNSILTEIKMIPYSINMGEQLEVFPYIIGDTKVVHIVDDCTKQDREHFDPVAFYGYLLGRAINNPVKKSIYTKYYISYPVKFNQKVKDSILKSLEYGLKMSLPIPLRTASDKGEKPIFSVKMKYSEPEAYVGAMVDKNFLNCSERPQLFSVFDFGGGTLDFSFGLLANGEDEIDRTIYFFGSGGKANFGGEYLISRISCWILTDESNRNEIIEKKIPIYVPGDLKKSSDFSESSFSTTPIAKANMRMLNEKVSRYLFEDKVTEENSTMEMQFFHEDGTDVSVSLAIDYSILRDKLSDCIDSAVEDFKCSMQLALDENIDTLNKYGMHNDINDVHIFKSGNASRSSLVAEKMTEKFPQNKIDLIDELRDSGIDMRYAITPKTAVAHGQIKLSAFDIKYTRDFHFNWNILQRSSGGGYKTLINQFERDKKWKFYDRIRRGSCRICYSESPITTGEPLEQNYEHDKESGFLYVRIADETSIECFVSDEKLKSTDEIKEQHFEKITLKKEY